MIIESKIKNILNCYYEVNPKNDVVENVNKDLILMDLGSILK